MSAVKHSAIAEAIARHGNIWSPQTNEEMQKLHEVLHAEKITNYENTVKVQKALKYGSSERHRIDVRPIASHSTRDHSLTA